MAVDRDVEDAFYYFSNIGKTELGPRLSDKGWMHIVQAWCESVSSVALTTLVCIFPIVSEKHNEISRSNKV